MAITSTDAVRSTVVAVVFVWLIYEIFAGSWASDLSAVYFGALSYGQGDFDLIYRAPVHFFGASASPEWDSMVAAFGHAGNPALPYIYAPVWAAMLAPIATRVDPIAFFDAVLVVHGVLCTASVLLAYRIVAPARMTLFVWSLISLAIILLVTPFYTAFWLNQPQISVTFLILLAFERHVKGTSVAAGVALGIAVAIKITPAVFIVIFVMDRNFRAAGVTIAVALAVLGLSVAIAGIDLHRAFLDQLVRAVDFAVLTPLNYSLEGLAATFAGIHGDVVRDTDVASGFVILETSPWFGLVYEDAGWILDNRWRDIA